MTRVPKYWNKAKKYLSKKDKILSKLIKSYESPSETILTTRRDIFFSLCKSIIGQQISVAAANSVFLKFKKKCKNKINAKTVSKLTFAQLKSCGLSRQKVLGIKSLAKQTIEKTFNPKLIDKMSDEEAIDYLSQLRQMKKMGGLEGVMSFLPGVSKIKSQMDQAGVDEKIITQNEAVILSMTKYERENPKIIDGSRKKRIANGSGTDPATINKLLKQFKMMSEMMKKMSKGNLKGMTDKGIPPELFNQLK